MRARRECILNTRIKQALMPVGVSEKEECECMHMLALFWSRTHVIVESNVLNSCSQCSTEVVGQGARHDRHIVYILCLTMNEIRVLWCFRSLNC